MDYLKFESDFYSSGLTQKQYGESIGMSASMVSYYLKRAKLSQKKQEPTPVFKAVKIKSEADRSFIRIKTSLGMTIEIPV